MEPTTQLAIAILVFALLKCLQRRRTGGLSDEQMMDIKRQQWGERRESQTKRHFESHGHE